MNCLNVLVIVVWMSLASISKARDFDVTKYGAKADLKTDISQPLLKAWAEACSTPGSSKVFIPKGIYALREINFDGPCKGSMTVQIDGTLKAPTDHKQFSSDAWIRFRHVDFLTVIGGIFDGQGKTAWEANHCAQNPDCKMMAMNLRFDFVSHSKIMGITSRDSKNFHINVLGCENITFEGVTIKAPELSKNTDGIHIGRSKGVNIMHATIATGDDCISIGDGSQKVTIEDVKCGPGHGISVGSLGKYQNEEPVEGIYVRKCTIFNTLNGVRVKSWPAKYAGSANDLRFEDITMSNVSNPVLIDQEYCPWGKCNNEAPSKVKISKVGFKNIKGTSATPVAVQLICSSGIPCENVELTNINLEYKGNQGPAKSECKNVKPMISGLNPKGC